MAQPRILVTGGAGYIGSHACKALRTAGYEPVCYDNLESGNSEAVKWGPLEQGDIRDRDRLKAVLAQYQPAAVMHFAALIQVGESVKEPAKYYDNNLLGTYCLLEEARVASIKQMVFSSTAAVYGIPQTELIAEDHPKNPINPYGQTKLAMEGMIRDYAAAYGFNYAILRYFNAAGADAAGELGTAYADDTQIEPMLKQAATGQRQEFKLFGDDYPTKDGSAMRDFIHITDLVDAHVLALQHMQAGKGDLTLNLGTNKATSVKEMLTIARQVTGKPIPSSINPRRAGDPPLLAADASAARKVLNWTPQHSDIANIITTAWQWQQKLQQFGRKGAFSNTKLKEAS
jgi:UDP-arabinose 4-epimerase